MCGERDNCWQSFVRASYKTDGAANEDAVEIKFALPYEIYSGLIGKAGVNDINISNRRVVTVTSLILFLNVVGRPILMCRVIP